MLDGWSALGLLIVLLDLVLIGGTIPAIVLLVVRWRFGIADISNLLLMVSIVLAQPVLILENLIALQELGWKIPFQVTLEMLKLSFVLGSLAIVVFNLQLLILEDFSSFAIGLLMFFIGISTGAMFAGLQLDLNRSPPILYTPLIAGILFIGSLMLFNVIGLIGLFLSISKGSSIHALQLMAAVFFFLGPILVFFTRIVLVVSGPVNLFALPFLFSFLLLLGHFFIRRCGFHVRSQLNGVLIMDADREVVIGGYRFFGNPSKLTLEGMALMASQTVLSEAIGVVDQLRSNNFVYLKAERYVILAILTDGGEKIGRFCSKRFALQILNQYPLNSAEFCRILHFSFFPFFNCDAPTEDNVFIQDVV